MVTDYQEYLCYYKIKLKYRQVVAEAAEAYGLLVGNFI